MWFAFFSCSHYGSGVIRGPSLPVLLSKQIQNGAPFVASSGSFKPTASSKNEENQKSHLSKENQPGIFPSKYLRAFLKRAFPALEDLKTSAAPSTMRRSATLRISRAT